MSKSVIVSIDIDPQIGFVEENELPVPDGGAIVDELNANARLSVLRILTLDCHPPNAEWITHDKNKIGKPIEPPVSKNCNFYWPPHCIVGTKGCEPLFCLPKPIEYNFCVRKGIEPDIHPYGAAYHDLLEKQSTGLIEYLRANDAKFIIVGGLALDFCVLSTVKQLYTALGNSIFIINMAATRAINPELNSIEKFRSYLHNNYKGFFGNFERLILAYNSVAVASYLIKVLSGEIFDPTKP